jgi:Ni,Fe-hydrogenase I cytochrome b subunit
MMRSIFNDFSILKLEGYNCLSQQELSDMFASFVYIVSFFELTCIDMMKLEFYATIVFMVLLDFVM